MATISPFTLPSANAPAPKPAGGINLLAGMGGGSMPSLSNYYSGANPALNTLGTAPSSSLSVKTGNTTGVNAKSPVAKVVGPSNTLPKAQINTSKPAAPIIPPATNTPAPVAPPAPPQSPYSNTLGLLGQAAQNNPYTQYNQQTANYGAGNIDIGNKAQQIADEYGKKIADVGARGIRYEGGQLTTGTSPVAEGNAAVTANLTAQQQQALAQAGNMALSGNAQALTGQNQAAGASNLAAGQANTAQGYLQGAYNTIAGYQKPELGSIGQVTFNPQTGSQGAVLGSTGGGLQQAGQLLGQFAGSQTLGAAPYNTQAQNLITRGTAITGANAQGLGSSIQQETTLTTAANNATQLSQQLQQALNNSGLHLTNSTDANTIISKLQSRLGNDAYTRLTIAVNDARSAYAGILTSMGATPTDAGAQASQSINDTMSPKQILGAIEQLNQGVNSRLQTVHGQTQQYQTQLQGSGGASAPKSSGTASGFGWGG